MDNRSRIFELESVPSTNTWMKENSDRLRHFDTAFAVSQTAGRGQRGNTWESEPGKNVTLSMFVKPAGLAPARQFLISKAVALAVRDTVFSALGFDEAHGEVSVKWPNDIYVGDRKIAGILIEHTLSGSEISHTIVGIGLNVNQPRFLSDAPNPVSLYQLTGRDYPLGDIADDLVSALKHRIGDVLSGADSGNLGRQFHRVLWRREGVHPFATPDGCRFMASIDSVSPSGELNLRLADGSLRSFLFKEVAFVLN